MGKVIAEQSMSLDGFSTGPNISVGDPLGENGELLHEWMFPPQGINFMVRDEMFSTAGAVVMGRRMFDLGLEPWGDDPPFHMPVFVVTRRPRDPLPMQGGTTYHFVTGVEPALEAAKAAAQRKDVTILGGANTIQQLIQAGLIDELRIHVAPVLLGAGTRLFEAATGPRIDLEIARVIDGPGVTHLTFRVTRSIRSS